MWTIVVSVDYDYCTWTQSERAAEREVPSPLLRALYSCSTISIYYFLLAP